MSKIYDAWQKLNIQKEFSSTGTIGSDVYNCKAEHQLRVVVENVGVTNSITVKARAYGATAWADLGTITGASASGETYDISTYDELQFNCNTYSASGTPKLVASGFIKRSSATSSSIAYISSVLGEYKVDANDITPPPASGYLKYDNATQISATNIYIHDVSSTGIDTSIFFDLLQVGTRFVIQDKDDHANIQIFELTSLPIDNTTYYTMPVTLISSNGDGTTGFANNHSVIVAAFNDYDGLYARLDSSNQPFTASAGVESLDTFSRQAHDISGNLVLDWDNTQLIKSGISIFDWSSGIIKDYLDVYSADLFGRYLYDSAQVASIHYGSRYLTDSSNLASVDWQGRILYSVSQVISVNYESRELKDSSGITSVSFDARTLIDNGSFVSVDWINRQLKNTSFTILDWSNMVAYDQYGVESVRWSDRKLYDSTAFYTVDYEACDLYSTSGVPALNWAGTEIDLFKNTILSKANPRFTLSDTGDTATAYLEKLTTGNEYRVVSQNRPYVAGFGVLVSTTAQRASFGTHTFPDWSLSFWVKTTSTGQNMFAGRIIDNTSALVYWESNSLLYRITGTTKTFTGYSALSDGNWHHIVFAVAKNANTYVYFDGVQSAAQTGINADITLTHILGGGTGSIANGTFDEIILFNSQIDSTKVSELYNAGAPIKLTNYTGVYAAWHLDDGSGTTYADSSGNSRTATAGAAVSWVTGKVPSAIQALEDVEVNTLVNNGTHNSYGDLTTGYYSSTKGTTTIGEGLEHKWKILGTEVGYWSSSVLSIGTLGSGKQSGTIIFGRSNTVVEANSGGTITFGLSNIDNRGHSIIVGVSNTANNTSGTERAVAIGFSNSISGQRSLVCGVSNTASTSNAIAVGYANTASGSSSVAVGQNCQAAANQIAIGLSAVSSGSGFLSIGTSTTSTGSGSIAIGQSITAAGSNTINIGQANSNTANNTFLIGTNNTTTSGNTTKMVLGQSNTLSGGGGSSVVGFSNATFRSSNTSVAQVFGYANGIWGDSSCAYGRSLSSRLPNNAHYGISSVYYALDQANNRYSIHSEPTIPGMHINRDVLIMDASSLGSELISNPDFSSGPFTGWDVGANWSWSGGNSRAEHTGASDTALKQTQFVTQGAVYEITFNTMTFSSGATFYFSCAGYTLPTITLDATSTASSLTYRFVAVNGGGLSFSGNGLEIHATGTFTLDNVSMKQVTGGKLTVLKELYVGNDTDSQDHKLTNAGVIINENGLDLDTRIEGDTDQNLLVCDGSADTVQVGSATTADSAKFYVNGKISTSGEMEINGALNHDGSTAGFFGAAPATQQTLAAYTSDGEGAAYTGIDNLQVGTVYATVADLNQLRVAYENLRASYDDLRTKLLNTTLVN